MNKANKKIVFTISILLIVIVGSIVIIFNLPQNRMNRAMDLAIRYIDDGNWEEAKVQLNKVIAIDATNLDAYIMLADVYMNQGDLDGAISTYESIIELDESRVKTYEDLITVYTQISDVANVIKTYERLIRIVPDDYKLYLELADIYIEQENLEAARDILVAGFERTNNDLIKSKLEEVLDKLALLDEYAKLKYSIYGRWIVYNYDYASMAEQIYFDLTAPNAMDLQLGARFFYRGNFELKDNVIDCELQGYECHDPADPYNLEFNGKVNVHLEFVNREVIFSYSEGTFTSDPIRLYRCKVYSNDANDADATYTNKALNNSEITENFLRSYMQEAAAIAEDYLSAYDSERLDYNDTISVPREYYDEIYYRVKDKNFKGRQTVCDDLNRYYIPNITNGLIDMSIKDWVEKDGVFYESPPGDKGSETFAIEVDVLSISENHVFLCLKETYFSEAPETDFRYINMNKIDGRWLFDSMIPEEINNEWIQVTFKF